MPSSFEKITFNKRTNYTGLPKKRWGAIIGPTAVEGGLAGHVIGKGAIDRIRKDYLVRAETKGQTSSSTRRRRHSSRKAGSKFYGRGGSRKKSPRKNTRSLLRNPCSFAGSPFAKADHAKSGEGAGVIDTVVSR